MVFFVSIHHPQYSYENTRNRDYLYATRTPINNFDDPLTFKGKIKARYLQKANNFYEAVILPEHIRHLEIDKFLHFPIREMTEAERVVIARNHINSLSVQRVAKEYRPDRLNRLQAYLKEFELSKKKALF